MVESCTAVCNFNVGWRYQLYKACNVDPARRPSVSWNTVTWAVWNKACAQSFQILGSACIERGDVYLPACTMHIFQA